MNSLYDDLVLGMLFLRAMNSSIDWNRHFIVFNDGNEIQAIPVEPGQYGV